MTHINHYKIEGPAVVNFSGGRSSGYMLHRILDAHNGKLPDNVIPIFCNTGKEREETLEFVHNCSQQWNVEIVWLEYRWKPQARGGVKDPRRTYEIVTYHTASRNGEPFDQLIDSDTYIPQPSMRICTKELKVETVKRYMYHQHNIRIKRYTSVLGIRHDERKRWQKLIENQRGCHRRYNKQFLPMVYEQNNRNDVDSFWKNNSFDLQIPSQKSNCDLCFLKSKKILIETIRENPELAKWWINHEKRNLLSKKNLKDIKFSYFHPDYSYEHLLELSKLPPEKDLFDYAEENGIDCFCTD